MAVVNKHFMYTLHEKCEHIKNNQLTPVTMNESCLIIDSDRKAVFKLQLLLHKNGFAKVFVATDPNSVHQMLMKEKVTVVFIRIKLWRYRLIKTKNSLEQLPAIVFLSSMREKFKEDLDEQVDYHISEPYGEEKLQNVLQRLKKEAIITNSNFLFIKHERRYRKVPFETIELVEKMAGNYMKLHTTTGKFFLVGTLNSFMDKLPGNLFKRISDKLIIPVKDKDKIKGNKFFYKDKELMLTHKRVHDRKTGSLWMFNKR